LSVAATLNEGEIWQHLDQLTKPPRSLGKLETLAARLCMIQQTLTPITKPRRLVLFAADHGVVAEGVSAWPAEVTGLMIDNIRRGGAASSVLAEAAGVDLRLIDVGARSGGQPLEQHADEITYRKQRVRAGSRNLHREPALSEAEFEQALQIGRDEAALAQRDAVAVVACGEMGIGNTTPAACLTMLLADVPLLEAVGRGAGADDQVLRSKQRVVGSAVERARASGGASSMRAIASVAGLEIAAMAGFFAAAHQAGLTIVLDGYVTTAAALIADTLAPGCSRSMIAAHQSAEPGHQGALQRLDLEPFLTWDLRLGEGTGGLLLLPLLDAASAICAKMRTLAEMGIAPEVRR
jgi:nicotinate-nucleotide--dimethylbenzimidazole phosphoribosyltransferase